MRATGVEERGWRCWISWNPDCVFNRIKRRIASDSRCPPSSLRCIQSAPSFPSLHYMFCVRACFQLNSCWRLCFPRRWRWAQPRPRPITSAGPASGSETPFCSSPSGEVTAAPLSPQQGESAWQPWLAVALCCCGSDRGSTRCSRSRNAKSWGPFCWGGSEREQVP